MPIGNDFKKCISCGACLGVCPVNCMTMENGKIIIDNEKCINCMACVRICPVSANFKIEQGDE